MSFTKQKYLNILQNVQWKICKSVHVYMYVCICPCTRMHANVPVYVCGHVCVCVCVCVRAHTCVHVCEYTCFFVCVCVCVHTCMCVGMGVLVCEDRWVGGHSASAACVHSVVFPFLTIPHDLSILSPPLLFYFPQLMQVVHRQSEQIAEVSLYVNTLTGKKPDFNGLISLQSVSKFPIVKAHMFSLQYSDTPRSFAHMHWENVFLLHSLTLWLVLI